MTTNRELLVGILRDGDFLAGATDTGFLERKDPAILSATRSPVLALLALAAALGGQATRHAALPLTGLRSGWRNVGAAAQVTRLSVSPNTNFSTLTGHIADEFDGGQPPATRPGSEPGAHRSWLEHVVRYRFTRDGLEASVDGFMIDALVVGEITDERVELCVAAVSRRYEIHRRGAAIDVDGPDGHLAFTEIERFPVPVPQLPAGSLQAPMPGSVVRILRAVGDRVTAREPVVVIEAMKMEHQIRAARAGTVASLPVGVGQQVDTGTVLAIVDPDPDE